MIKLLMILVLALSIIVTPAFSQIQNPQQGGPIVPKGNSTQQQYCFNGSCQTPNTIHNETISSNNTDHEIKSKYNIIMIIPSELCTKAISYGVKTGCPPLENLTKYDTSNKNISGYFYSLDGKILQRSAPQVKNHWMYYAYSDHTIVCVYCTGNYLTTDLYKTIIIEPDKFEYVPKSFGTSTYTIDLLNGSSGNYTHLTYQQNDIYTGLTSYLNREVRGCNTATISYSDKMLNNTIRYLESDCKITLLNETNEQKVPNSPWDWNNPLANISVKYKSAVDKVKAAHPGLCWDGSCGLTTSTKKPGW